MASTVARSRVRVGTARTRNLPFRFIAPPLQLVGDLAGPPHLVGVGAVEKPPEGTLHPRGGKVGRDVAELAAAVLADPAALAGSDRDVLRHPLPRHPPPVP